MVGDFFALDQRADLRVKVEARLQTLFRCRMHLRWTQNGLRPTFVSGQNEYSANTEASGVMHLIGLLAALYDDEVGAILIDEPEISLHPQLQAYLLEEIRQVAGDPARSPGKKLVVLSTHAQGMLPLRRITDLPNLIFFTDARAAPRQVPPETGELQRRGLAALVTRLGDSHRSAFFAATVLLVEGPSGEIVASALAARFGCSLAGAGAQIVPVIGKGEMPETARLFRLMGKRVVILADLDALADDNKLIGAFAGEQGATAAASGAGHSDLQSMDRLLRNDFARTVADRWTELKPLAAAHRYCCSCKLDEPTDKDRRRAALAVVLSTDDAALQSLPHLRDLVGLRNRFGALLSALEAGGCFLLRRGTIEDCYLTSAAPSATGKPEAAVDEIATFAEATEGDLRQHYADVLRAIEYAAPTPPTNENASLRRLLASLLGAAFQMLKHETEQQDLNAGAAAANPDAAQIFTLENASAEFIGTLALRVRIISPIFARPTFPAVIRRDQNLHTEVERLLQ